METKPQVPKLGSIHYITYATLKQIWKGDFINGSMLPSTLAITINLHRSCFDHFAYLAYLSFATIFLSLSWKFIPSYGQFVIKCLVLKNISSVQDFKNNFNHINLILIELWVFFLNVKVLNLAPKQSPHGLTF